ncbi:MAG: endolytic transglycosylase MltG [Patescibacteria group bacterium]|jgi:UPF0755 protein
MKAISAIVITLLAVILVAVGAFWYFTRLLQPPAAGSTVKNLTFEIKSGQTVKEISVNLEQAGMIRDDRIFRIYIWLEGLTSKLQAGSYTLNTGQSVETLVAVLTKGDADSNEVKFLVQEGLTVRQIADIYGRTFAAELKQPAETLASDFRNVAAVSDSRDILPGRTYEFLIDKPATAGLEGFLYPDTYRVYKDASPAQVIQKMLDNFNIKVDQSMRDRIARTDLNLFQTLTLASIVEKEVRSDTDRRMVADLFKRRLAMNMPMQSDATVNFVTNKESLQPTIDDTKVASPYNTYLNTGLPPGPICNPSLSSIEAVINPEPNDFLYYLNAPDGRTIFSRTFDEHKINKAKYLD